MMAQQAQKAEATVDEKADVARRAEEKRLLVHQQQQQAAEFKNALAAAEKRAKEEQERNGQVLAWLKPRLKQAGPEVGVVGRAPGAGAGGWASASPPRGGEGACPGLCTLLFVWSHASRAKERATTTMMP